MFTGVVEYVMKLENGVIFHNKINEFHISMLLSKD